LLPNTAKAAPDALSFLAKAGRGRTVIEFEQDKNIFEQGDAADVVYYIHEGKIKLTVLSAQGKEAVVGILTSGQFFGQSCLNGRKLRLSTTTTMEYSVLTAITKAAMIAMLRDEPEFAAYFMAYLLTRNSRIEEDLVDQLFNSSERRLARVLLLLAKFDKEAIPQPISQNISQETLAEMIGTTRSRVSFFMNKFRKMGLISYDRGLIEIKSALLTAVLNESLG
jgi:CRP-like cAMP-binding protein